MQHQYQAVEKEEEESSHELSRCKLLETSQVEVCRAVME